MSNEFDPRGLNSQPPNPGGFGLGAMPSAIKPSGELDLDALRMSGVNNTWLRKLQEIHNAGIVSIKYGLLATQQKLRAFTRFNVWAFLFTWIYYLVKGMWKKGLVILLGGIVYIVADLLLSSVVASIISESAGEMFARIMGLFYPLLVAHMAAGDYYRFKVLKEDFWV